MKVTSNVCLKFVLYAVECVTLFFVFYFSLMRLQGSTRDREFDILKNAIEDASVECYATEGMYPPSIEYLEENYGVQIDRTKYDVFYSGFASNVAPDITIVPIDIEAALKDENADSIGE